MGSQTKHSILERFQPSGSGFVETTENTSDSVELTRNAKGDYQWTVKLYFQPKAEVEAMHRLDSLDRALRKQYLPQTGSNSA